MRKLIDSCYITLDGVMQALGGPEEDRSGGFKYGGWVTPFYDEFLIKVLDEETRDPFDLLLGRKTFEIFAAYWPHHADEVPGAGINKATKYVVSRSLTAHEWDKSVFLNGDVVEEVRKIKQQDGPDIQIFGSGELIQTLLKHDLIDEFWLKIVPITLGTGKRLFADGTIPAAFKVTKSQVSPTGVMVATLVRSGEVQTGTVGE